ncbi:MAG: hypothetical protein FWF26_04545, partial [Treponema sp.]|nr:hypothetical protein [Treponema sp.]
MIFPGHGNRFIKILAVAFLLLSAAASLYARGAREDAVLSRADKLISDKDYDDAVQLLSDYMKTNPDAFGEAQMRLQKIISLREQYNRIANELLDTIESDPENSEKIFDLSNQLLTIESPNNPATKRFLDQVRFLAEFNVNKKRLQQIFLAAHNQLQANDFSGALTTYASGLDIYQSKYFSSGYGQDAEDVGSSGLKSINDNIRSFNGIIGPFSIAAQAISASQGQTQTTPKDIAAEFAELSPL